jgi:hypothetical protein
MGVASVLAFIALFLGAFGSPVAASAKKKTEQKVTEPLATEPSATEAIVGEARVGLLAPAELTRVDGLSLKGDEFVESLKGRFKLRVLAVYARPDEYLAFVKDLDEGRASLIPRLALISVPTRMDKKTYDQKAVTKEWSRYREWFSLAINTRPLVWFFGRKANGKLKDKLGRDLGFSYQTGEGTGRFDENDRSLSFSVRAKLDLNGGQNDILVAASALNVADKLVFLSYIEPVPGPAELTASLAKARGQSLVWLSAMAKENDVTLKPKS